MCGVIDLIQFTRLETGVVGVMVMVVMVVVVVLVLVVVMVARVVMVGDSFTASIK